MNAPRRWIDVNWNEELKKHQQYAVRLALIVDPHLGNMAAITALIARQNAPILDLKFKNKTTEFYEISIDLGVTSLVQLQTIIATLRTSSHVISVERS